MMRYYLKEPSEIDRQDMVHIVDAPNAATARGKVAEITGRDRLELEFVTGRDHTDDS